MLFDFEFRSRRSNIFATHGMVASSQPLATMAGLDILRNGGTAADAAVTTAAMLNVVEPFSTGIGGDCFVLYWDAKEKKVFALNGSGPAAQDSDIETLKQSGFDQYPLHSGHAVSVPGTVAAWDSLLKRFGRFSFQEVLAPAVKYALEGYPVTEWIGSGWVLMESHLQRINSDENLPNHLKYFGPPQPSGNEFLLDGRAPKIGERMTLPTLGKTLQQIASGGVEFFYKGDFANHLCDYVQQYGGWLQSEDMAGYLPEWVEPLYADYHDVRLYECPPNGQGLAIILAAKIANQFDLVAMDSIERTHTLIECMRLGFFDALKWISDPNFHTIPYNRLFSEIEIDSKHDMITADRAIKYLPSGIPPSGNDTVYLSVVDQAGNACSFINSLFMGGGTGLVVPGTGVILQNRAALFSLDPLHPNALEGGKRPYNTIIPGMLVKNGELMASFGVMGGFMQPQGHLQILSNLVDMHFLPQQALDSPRFCIDVQQGVGVGAEDPGGEVLIEKGYPLDQVIALHEKGHHLRMVKGRGRFVFGGGQIIQRNPDTGILIGGSDPRKDGCALGW